MSNNIGDGESKWARIEYDGDPERCQGIDQTGQCRYKKVAGTNFCARHGFNGAEAQAREKIVRNYRLQRWQERVGEFAHAPGVKSLREEIGISRVVLEETLNLCNGPNELLLNSEKIQATICLIEKLIVSCQKLEERNSLLLDKGAIINLTDTLVQIIGEHITDADILKNIGDKFVAAIVTTAGSKTASGSES